MGLSFPNKISIEQTNACNYNCVMCPNSIITVKKGFMDFDLHKKIIDECVEYKDDIDFIALTGRGESLLHPKIFDIINYTTDKDFNQTRISTNASLLNQDSIDKLLDTNLDLIIISVNASNPEGYEMVCPGQDFKIVEENIDYIIERMNKIKPKIFLRTTEIPGMKSELRLIKRKWKGKISRIYSSVCYNWVGGIKMDYPLVHHPIPCKQAIYDEMRIMWNGNVVPCCWDYNEFMILGNVKENIVNESWTSIEYMNFRKRHWRYDPPDICKKCGYYKV